MMMMLVMMMTAVMMTIDELAPRAADSSSASPTSPWQRRVTRGLIADVTNFCHQLRYASRCGDQAGIRWLDDVKTGICEWETTPSMAVRSLLA